MSKKAQDGLPLTGVRVLDLTRLIPGACCSTILADAGAEVIKVEEPEIGDYERQIRPFIGSMASRFLLLNRNKKSLAIDLKKDKGREIFLELVKSADVLIEGFRPGAMLKLGLDYESLHEINQKLIYCSISSFGHDGPCRDEVSHDLNILGLAGFFHVTGGRDKGSVIPGMQIADAASGANAAMAILLAIMQRQKTGLGQRVDISMFDGVLSWMFDAARYAFAGETVPPGGEGRLNGGFPNYNIYETADGKHIVVGSLETKFKNELLKKLNRQDLIDADAGTTSSELNESDKELHDFLASTFLTKKRDEWVAELGPLNICVSPVNSVEEALDHPQAHSRKLVFEADHPSAGRIKQIGTPLKFSDMQLELDRYPAPEKGEHTREILTGLGYDADIIDALKSEGVVRE